MLPYNRWLLLAVFLAERAVIDAPSLGNPLFPLRQVEDQVDELHGLTEMLWDQHGRETLPQRNELSDAEARWRLGYEARDVHPSLQGNSISSPSSHYSNTYQGDVSLHSLSGDEASPLSSMPKPYSVLPSASASVESLKSDQLYVKGIQSSQDGHDSQTLLEMVELLHFLDSSDPATESHIGSQYQPMLSEGLKATMNGISLQQDERQTLLEMTELLNLLDSSQATLEPEIESQHRSTHSGLPETATTGLSQPERFQTSEFGTKSPLQTDIKRVVQTPSLSSSVKGATVGKVHLLRTVP